MAILLQTTEDAINHYFRTKNPATPSHSVETALDHWHIVFQGRKIQDEILPLGWQEIYDAAIARIDADKR